MRFRLVMSLVLGLSLAVGGLWPRGLGVGGGGPCATSCGLMLSADVAESTSCCCLVAPESAPEFAPESASDSDCCCSEPVVDDSCCAEEAQEAEEASEATCCSEASSECACSAEGGCICCGVLQRGGDCRCPSTPSTLLVSRGSSLESITAQGRGMSGDVGYPSLTVPVRLSVAVGDRCVPQRAYRPAGIRAQTNVRTI